MRARLIDVAAKAGVAPNTASVIINRRPGSWASDSTRDRVLQAARELNYLPSKAAVGLRTGRYHSIGLVLPDLHNPFYLELADLLEQAIMPAGFKLIIEHSRNDLVWEQHCYRSMLDRQVDGMALVASDVELHRPFLSELALGGPPAVVFSAKPHIALPLDTVVSDFSSGFEDAIDHLIRLGHRRFAFLCALAAGQSDGNRSEFFRTILRKRGIDRGQFCFVRCKHDIASARDSLRRLLQEEKTKRPTALIALNDLSAIGAMRAAADARINVPNDLSIIGVDGIPLGGFLPVALTTIAQPLDKMVSFAAGLLLARISKKTSGPPGQHLFPTALVVRESTALNSGG